MKLLKIHDLNANKTLKINLRKEISSQEAVNTVYEAIKKVSPCSVKDCFTFHVDESFGYTKAKEA